MLRKLAAALYRDSPQSNLQKLRARFAPRPQVSPARAPHNHVLSELLASPFLPRLVAHAVLRSFSEPAIFAGASPEAFRPALEELGRKGRQAVWQDFQWREAAKLPAQAEGRRVVLCELPSTAEHWTIAAELKRRLGDRLFLLTEILLPYTRVSFLQTKLNYNRATLAAILPYYLGDKCYGPLDKLDALFPLGGRSIIEFGPFDGCQTASLVHLGAASVTCIEARAENAAKTRTAVEVFGWPGVRVVMDDFHNADAGKYGRFDLAFAHGVYYHSLAPFVFLENLLSLSPSIFLGGFCATDSLPDSPWIELSHEGRVYRAKAYTEKNTFTAGVNEVAYFFHAEDLARFFTERGCRVQMISDEPTTVTAGQFIRFLATRQ
jgi:hypothetical protein